MSQLWKELLAVDRYVVRSNGLLHDYDRKVLTFLYQPLIGATSLSFYLTLWAELEENIFWSKPSTHHRLMVLMDLNLKQIYEARLKLEGIGLISTLVRDEKEERDFIYQLNPPLTPDEFFKSDMLNIPLFRKIGQQHYARIKRFFSYKRVDVVEGFSEVTKGYDEVFELVPEEAFKSAADLAVEDGKEFIGRNTNAGIELKQFTFNFDLLKAGLSESLVPKAALNDKVKDAIRKLAFLYGIDAVEMKTPVLDATENGQINIEELRNCVREWYQRTHGGLPTLVDRTQSPIYKTEQTKPQTPADEYVINFETKSPRQILREMGGGEPSKADLKIIEDIMFQQGLEPGVVNVLINFVMYQTDMKLPRTYIERIAGHWARKNVKTVKEAMELARKEVKQYKEWATKENNKKDRSQKKPIRTEKLPDWFNKEEKKSVVEEAKEIPADFADKMRALEENMKKLRK